MPSKRYVEKATALSQAIDIAIATFREVPPEGFSKADVEHFVTVYLDWKDNLFNTEPQFLNVTSLAYVEADVFTYFQEATGNTVNLFWEKIKAAHLPYKRVDKLAKILKRGRIKDDIEYQFITDVLVAYKQEGRLTEEEATLLSNMIGEFEKL